MINTEIYHRDFNIDSQLVKLSSVVEKNVTWLDNIKQVSAYNQQGNKAMQEYRVSDSHFRLNWSGYNDRGRSYRERICSCIWSRRCTGEAST